MVRTLLVSCNIADDPYPVYPLGMSLVAAFARQKGHEVFEIDLRANEDPIKFLEDAISELLPKAIGLSLRNVDNTDSTNPRLYIEFYKTISKKIRSVSNANLIIGGAAFSLFPNEMMDYLDADYGIVGEGEEAFAELLNCISNSMQPDNKIISRNVEINNSTAFLSRNKKIAESYSNQTGMLNIQTKRGCPHKCAYCSYPILEGSCYRFRDASRVADEIEMLINEYGISHYVITDSVFNDKEKRYLDIAEELVRRGIKTPYVSFMKPDKFTLDEARLLKKSGLSAVEWGSDASSDETLAGLCKDFLWSDVISSINIFNEAEISNSLFAIFGGPNETESTLQKGLENINNLNGCVVFAYSGIRILPKTKIYSIALTEGIINNSINLLAPKFYFSPHLTAEYIDKAVKVSFGSRMDRIYPPDRDKMLVHSFHKMGYKGPIWDLILKKRHLR